MFGNEEVNFQNMVIKGSNERFPYCPHGVNFSNSIFIWFTNFSPQAQLDIALCKVFKDVQKQSHTNTHTEI